MTDAEKNQLNRDVYKKLERKKLVCNGEYNVFSECMVCGHLSKGLKNPHHFKIPAYHLDVAYCFEIMERLLKDGWMLYLSAGGEYAVGKPSENTDLYHVLVKDASLEIAILKAALKKEGESSE